MSRLRIYEEGVPDAVLAATSNHTEIARELAKVGVRFEQWEASKPVGPNDPPEAIIAAYREEIERLKRDEGYQAVDVVSLSADHPKKQEFRDKFLNEHVHSEDEVRFFVAGAGLFTLHIDDKVYEVLCEQGDLIGVPDNTRHWFDMGPNPFFVAIRLFTNVEGWVAQFTGDEIAQRFPRHDN
jgi:1,2-dihydroxy-3-keto-5-methylthiopentene dioxygenase